MSTFFPTFNSVQGSVAITGDAIVYADGLESAWSIIQRLTQSAKVTGDHPYRVEFDETSKILTIFGSVGQPIPLVITDMPLTGFTTATTNSQIDSSVLTTCHVVQGLTVPQRALSLNDGTPSANGQYVGGGMHRAGSITILVSDTYANIFPLAKTLRNGIWDVVQHGVWEARIRVTGTNFIKQGKRQSNVTLEINAQIVV